MSPVPVERLAAILEGAHDTSVLVVGDLMLDRYLLGSVDRISPEAPVPVLTVEEESSAVGGAGNVAANVVSLGARCSLVGCVGEDEGGRELEARLVEAGIGTGGVVRVPTRPTTVKTRVMARRQQIVRVDREEGGDVSETVAAELVDRIGQGLEGSDSTVLEDYNKGVLVPAVIRAALDGAASGSVPSVVDPKRWRFFEYGGATVFKPNLRELAEALSEPPRPDDPEWMESTRERLGCEVLLLTLGESGMALQSRESGAVRIPAMARSVYDVSGAGDTVTAAVAVALAAGATPLEAAVLANHAAAVVVGKAGVHPATADEVLEQAGRFPL